MLQTSMDNDRFQIPLKKLAVMTELSIELCPHDPFLFQGYI
jgi:hypothetical protein